MNQPHWNPVLFWFPEPSAEDPAGKLWLHFKVQHKLAASPAHRLASVSPVSAAKNNDGLPVLLP